MHSHFLQSTAWQQFQESLGRKTFRQSGDGWEYLAILERGKGNTRLYCPYGPTARDAEALTAAVASLKQLAAAQHATFVRIEPLLDQSPDLLPTLEFRRTKDIQPSHSVINILGATENDVLSQTNQTIRRIWRKNLKAGVTFHTSHDPADMAIFIDMIHDVSKRTGMRPHSDTYFQTMASTLFPLKKAGIIYAALDGEPVASIIFFTDGTTASYAHAASYSAQRKLSPATALGVAMLLEAQRTGHHSFDFYGVAPDGAPDTHPWAGFTHFKKSFGGTPVTHPGTWDLPLKPLRYLLYKTYQALR